MERERERYEKAVQGVGEEGGIEWRRCVFVLSVWPGDIYASLHMA